MFLKTSDNIKISADWRGAGNPKGYLVLLHMMPATKNSWNNFADFMIERDYSSLAIDLRGHGESSGGPEGYKFYLDYDHQQSVLDVEAAVDFLKKQGAKPANTIFVGASFGANLALEYVATHNNFRKVIMLSGGLNYVGINAESFLKQLTPSHEVMLVSARDDERVHGNAEMNQKLSILIPVGVKKEIIIYETGGHGTDMFEQHPELMEKILKFVEE
jgi:alpha-beta hydrolase superfamily lysophospholipase